MNDSPGVRLAESRTLRLEFDAVGVIATVLGKDGAPLVNELNPARYPWGVVRKVTGEMVEHVTAKAPKVEHATAKALRGKFQITAADES